MTQDAQRAQVRAYYDAHPALEWGRLDRHRTELAVVLRALDEVLPAQSRVLDVGGGPGRYAIALTRAGHEVVLVDLAPRNLDLARQKAAEAGVSLAGVITADACALPDTCGAGFDAALLFGPLYHLLTDAERQEALRQASARVRPGGIVAATFISRFAPLRDASTQDPEWIIREAASLPDLLHTGIYDGARGFTAAHFAHPDDIAPMMTRAGLHVERILGCEGIVAGHEEHVNALKGAAWDAWVTLNRQLAEEPSLLGAADHLLCIARTSP